MQIVDKLKEVFKTQRKMIIFLLCIAITGIVFGSIFNIILDTSDKALVQEYIEKFFLDVQNNSINYGSSLKKVLINNLSYILITWLLGISIIGLPISLFTYFINAVILGFSISSIISVYHTKGIIYGLAYVFPHQILSILINTFLMVYVITISLYLIKSVFNKQTINFKNISNRYLIVLGTCIITIILNSLIEVFIMPSLIRIAVSLW